MFAYGMTTYHFGDRTGGTLGLRISLSVLNTLMIVKQLLDSQLSCGTSLLPTKYRWR